MSKNRLTNEHGQFTEKGLNYMERLEEVALPIFMEMFENNYDVSDIRAVKDEFMRFTFAKLVHSCKYFKKL